MTTEKLPIDALVEAIKGLLSDMETSAEFSDGKSESMMKAYAALEKAGVEPT